MLKPAETTPLTALSFAEIFQQADLPPGRRQHRHRRRGDRRGACRPSRRRQGGVHRLDRGRQGNRPGAVAGTGKKLTLELGGKAANIVFEDAPVDQAVEGIVNGIFFNQGHVCCAGSRLLVQESVARPVVVDKLKRRLATLRVGDPLDKNTDVGAINSAAQLDKIRELSEVGEAEGAQRWSPPCELPVKGYWFPPTVFTGVSQAHRIAQEEIFGPVLSVLTFRTPEEAVAEGQQHRRTGCRPGSGPRRASRSCGWPASCGPAWSGRTRFNQFRPVQSPSAATRSRASAARAAGTDSGPTSMSEQRLAVRKTYKLYIGGAFPRSEAGGPMWCRPKGRFTPTRRWLRERTLATQ